MLAGDDMVDLEGSVVCRLVHPAVFAPAFRPLPDQAGECRVDGRH
jgi:hypothetical protein